MEGLGPYPLDLVCRLKTRTEQGLLQLGRVAFRTLSARLAEHRVIPVACTANRWTDLPTIQPDLFFVPYSSTSFHIFSGFSQALNATTCSGRTFNGASVAGPYTSYTSCIDQSVYNGNGSPRSPPVHSPGSPSDQAVITPARPGAL